jgi:hypothetical protein
MVKTIFVSGLEKLDSLRLCFQYMITGYVWQFKAMVDFNHHTLTEDGNINLKPSVNRRRFPLLCQAGVVLSLFMF